MKGSKFGLLFNATLKVPMQFAILSIGVFSLFYQFVKPQYSSTSEIERAPLRIQNQLESIEFEHALV